jgi:hypothetical protein
MSLEYIGYHGTSLENAARILDQGFTVLTKDATAWLGTGIYFFERSAGWARWWISNRKYEEGAVLQASIVILDDSILFDLLDKDTHDWFEKKRQELLTRIKLKHQNVIHPAGPPYDADIINALCSASLSNAKRDIKLIRAAFQVRSQPKAYTDRDSKIARTHIQLCYRDIGCIKDIKLITP